MALNPSETEALSSAGTLGFSLRPLKDPIAEGSAAAFGPGDADRIRHASSRALNAQRACASIPGCISASMHPVNHAFLPHFWSLLDG